MIRADRDRWLALALLLAVLHALESARPWLFVDALGITAQRYFAVPGAAQPQEGGLDVGFNLYGYLRPAAGARP